MKKLMFIILIIICLFTSSCTKKEEYIRLRIIAEDETNEAVSEKIKIKDLIKDGFDEELLSYKSLNVQTLKEYLRTKLDTNLYQKLTIKKCVMNYEAKAYHNKIIPSGKYETVLINIGKGKGKNFWTLLYPEYFGFEFVETNEIEIKSYFFSKKEN